MRGNGVAAFCCARLLRNAGFRVAMERPDRPRVPAIMLSDAALIQMRDVFGLPDLFSSLLSLLSSPRQAGSIGELSHGEGCGSDPGAASAALFLNRSTRFTIVPNDPGRISRAVEDVWPAVGLSSPLYKAARLRGCSQPAVNRPRASSTLHLEAPDRQSVAAARYAGFGVDFRSIICRGGGGFCFEHARALSVSGDIRGDAV